MPNETCKTKKHEELIVGQIIGCSKPVSNTSMTNFSVKTDKRKTEKKKKRKTERKRTGQRVNKQTNKQKKMEKE